jgi:hypothetical protein
MLTYDKHRSAPEGHLRPGPLARTGRTPVQVWTHPEALGQARLTTGLCSIILVLWYLSLISKKENANDAQDHLVQPRLLSDRN